MRYLYLRTGAVIRAAGAAAAVLCRAGCAAVRWYAGVGGRDKQGST